MDLCSRRTAKIWEGTYLVSDQNAVIIGLDGAFRLVFWWSGTLQVQRQGATDWETVWYIYKQG